MALTSADRLLAPAVAETLTALHLGVTDQAAAKLAERYAVELDQAAAIAAHADRVLKLAGEADDPDLLEQVTALRNRLTARSCVADLGPKLLAVLDEVGGTPLGRARIAKLAPAGKAGPVPGSAALTKIVGALGA